ncbi:MAG: hypothetical protein MUP71_09695 [Candidatus Aminicenantes bacterium]|nr:hypothetical protein [Candidatus Aminicenantes bacterium]
MNKALFSLLGALALCLPGKELLEIKGDYLLYSYDFNYIYGQGNIQIKCKEWTIQAETVEIDMAGRAALASRNCRVEAGKQKYTTDMLEIDLEGLSLKFTTFQERILSWTLPGQKNAAAGENAAVKKITLKDHEALKKSLVYFLNQRIVITQSFRVYGYQTTVFIEGVQSLAFKKFKLDQGADETNIEGAGIDKIWYYPSEGLVINSHMNLEKKIKNGAMKTANSLDFKYDILNRIATGPRGKIYFISLNSLDLSKKSDLSLNVNFLTDNLFNSRLAFKTRWTPQFSSEWAAEYSRTATEQEELWLRLGSNLQNRMLGNLALNLSYEKEKQYVAEISLQNQTVKNINLSLQHARSRLRYGQDSYNRLLSSSFFLAYTHSLFNMAADYSFHKDLLQNQSQGTPRFTLNVSPFRLYHNLLQVNLVSSFMVNQLELAGTRNNQSKANLGLNLQSERIKLGRGPAFTMALAAEQLLDQERLNDFTSLGCVFKCSQNIAGFADLDFLYNYHTRRQTEKWFIRGSTSQDWSAVLRLKEGQSRVKGWLSLSYDTKTGNFTSAYLDCAFTLIKNWEFQTQLNYDFLFKNFNYDFYLIRRAGRIMVRASYRSLSRQFLLELLPQ